MSQNKILFFLVSLLLVRTSLQVDSWYFSAIVRAVVIAVFGKSLGQMCFCSGCIFYKMERGFSDNLHAPIRDYGYDCTLENSLLV